MSDSRREARGARRETGVARFDDAIDLAVREMLDVEPPAGLHGRVLDRIESPRRGFGWIWVAAPLAAAAIIVFAVLLPSTTDTTTTAPAEKGGSDHRLAVTPPLPRTLEASPTARPPVVTARAVTRPPRTGRAVAAAAPDEVGADVVWIDPLAPPPAMAVAAIALAQGNAMPSIDVAPAEIRALEIRPITDTPRERRNQE